MTGSRRTHASLVTAVIWTLEARGVFCWRHNTGSYRPANGRFVRYGFPGSPDVIGILPGGRWLGVECKTGRDRQSPLQRDFQARVERQGGCYALVRDVRDLEMWSGIPAKKNA